MYKYEVLVELDLFKNISLREFSYAYISEIFSRGIRFGFGFGFVQAFGYSKNFGSRCNQNPKFDPIFYFNLVTFSSENCKENVECLKKYFIFYQF
jgi:hypothetical protein